MTTPRSLPAMLAAAGVPWGQHWVAGGFAGTSELVAELEHAPRASDQLLDALAEVERTQRTVANAREREWQCAVEEVCARRGQLLSAATVDERHEVADRLAQAVQVLVHWGAG